MREATVLLMLILGISLTGTAEGNAFAELTAADAPDGDRVEQFLFSAKLAAEGSADAQIYLADQIFDKGDKSLAVRLYQSILDQRGYDVDPAARGYFLYTYAKLGEIYVAGEIVPPDLPRGLEILREVASQSTGLGQQAMFLALGSDLLPSRLAVRDLWWQYSETGESFDLDDITPAEESVPPPDGEYGPCGAPMDHQEQLMDLWESAQVKALDAPEAADSIISEAYAAANALDPGAHNLSFHFYNIPARPLLALLADILGHKANFADDNRPWPIIRIQMSKVPRAFAFAVLVNELALDVSCNGDTMRFTATRQTPTHEKRTYIIDFVTHVEPLVNEQVRMRWKRGHHYEGSVEGLVPSGKGVLIFEDGSTISGEFRDGTLHGQGEYLDNKVRVSGTFEKGLLEGEGTHINEAEGFWFEGPFAAGQFLGEGIQEFVDYEEESKVRYTGPFRDNVPHGPGTCAVPHRAYEYPCTFHRGELVRVGDVSLFPINPESG